MKFLAINEYLQTLATLGAIVGLIAVAYEIQQSNRIAGSETAAANWSQWISSNIGLIDSDIAEIRAKAMTNPEELTRAEKIDLDMYLESWVSLYEHNTGATYLLGVEGEEDWSDLYSEAAEEAPDVFGSSWSRAWLAENKDWITPQIFEAIERGLEGVPVGSDLDYYNRIDALAETIERQL